MSDDGPVIELSITIPNDKVGSVIGSKGSVINDIMRRTLCKVVINQGNKNFSKKFYCQFFKKNYKFRFADDHFNVLFIFSQLNPKQFLLESQQL